MTSEQLGHDTSYSCFHPRQPASHHIPQPRRTTQHYPPTMKTMSIPSLIQYQTESPNQKQMKTLTTVRKEVTGELTMTFEVCVSNIFQGSLDTNFYITEASVDFNACFVSLKMCPTKHPVSTDVDFQVQFVCQVA